MRQRLRTSRWKLISLLVVTAGIGGCAGKGAEGTCGGAEGTCGGDPSTLPGTYTLSQACQFPADQLYQPMSLTEQVMQPQNPSIAPLQPEPTTSGDWCSMLVYNAMGQVTSVNLWHDAPQLVGGTLELSVLTDPTTNATEKKYTASLNFSTPTDPTALETTHFSSTCLRYSGANPSCADLQAGISAFYKTAAGMKPVAFTNLTCGDAANGDGCDCTYVYSVNLTDEGAWDADTGFLVQSSGTYAYNGVQVASQAPTREMQSTYCQSGNTLTLTGYVGATIEDAVGLRTVVLTKNP